MRNIYRLNLLVIFLLLTGLANASSNSTYTINITNQTDNTVQFVNSVGGEDWSYKPVVVLPSGEKPLPLKRQAITANNGTLTLKTEDENYFSGYDYFIFSVDNKLFIIAHENSLWPFTTTPSYIAEIKSSNEASSDIRKELPHQKDLLFKLPNQDNNINLVLKGDINNKELVFDNSEKIPTLWIGEEKVKSFKNKVDAISKANPPTTVLFFTAEWCGPCKMMSPDVDQIKSKTGLEVLNIDIEKHPKMAEEFNVTTTPVLVMVDKDGTELARRIGAGNSSQLDEWISSNK